MAELSWKERLEAYDTLTIQLSNRNLDELLEVEVCFIEMLKEKNLNVAVKILELIRSYSKLQPITKVSIGELFHVLFNFCTIGALNIEALAVELYAKNDRRQLLESLAQCFRSKTIKKSMKAFRTLRLLVETYGVEALFWLEYTL
jgi:hypothetical protein